VPMTRIEFNRQKQKWETCSGSSLLVVGSAVTDIAPRATTTSPAPSAAALARLARAGDALLNVTPNGTTWACRTPKTCAKGRSPTRIAAHAADLAAIRPGRPATA